MSIKRKRGQDEPGALPAQAETGNATQVNGADEGAQDKPGKTKGRSRQERSERRSKKLKKSNKEIPHAAAEVSALPLDNKQTHTSETEVQTKEQAQQAGGGEASQSVPKKSKKPKKAKNPASNEPSTAEASTRFIVFVGNLPFNATAAQVRDHFAKLAPSSVRLSTDKATGKSKGFAFLEFDGYDKMKTCLKLYHHSLFDPQGKTDTAEAGGKTARGKNKPRRINVELTAGGGGKKSQQRLAKIKMKNEKLNEERKRRSAQEKSEQYKAVAKVKKTPGTGANSAEASDPANDDRGAIHPSRLARVMH